MNAIDEALRFVRRNISGMDGYVPGLQPSPGQRIVKLNTNENPYPPSPKVIEALHGVTESLVRLYPSPDATPLRERAAAVYGVHPDQVLCGNGSDEILSILVRTFLDAGETIAYFQPSYSLYPVLAGISQVRTTDVPLPRVSRLEEMGDIPVPSPRAKVFFLTTPNSPYGPGFPTAWIERLLTRFKGIVIADEAYADFAVENCLPLLPTHPRLIIVRTLSKGYSLAGMRAGLAIAHAELIREMSKVKDSYNVGRIPQIAACAALEDQAYFRATRDTVLATRTRLTSVLKGEGYTVLPSSANFVFIVPPAGLSARALYDGLVARGFLVRLLGAAAVSDGLRVSIGADADMDNLVKAMREVRNGGQ
jgi:histidinol-phosphate aminotransferase